MKNFTIIFLSLFFICILTSSGYAQSAKNSRTAFLFSTIVTINIFEIDGDNGKELLDKAYAMMEDFDKKYSPSKDNIIGKINSLDSGEVLVLDTDLYNMIKKAEINYEISGGYYDITIGPLSKLFGFKTDNPSLPSEKSIKSTLSKTGFKFISLNENKEFMFLKQGMKIDTGGLAKGYIIDKVYDFFKENGVTSALINGGGDIRVIGKKKDRPFIIGISDPENPGLVMAKIELYDGEAVATSGDYERFFFKDDIRYCHIFNPKTGYPGMINHGSTVVAKTSVIAEALSLSSFLMTGETALKYIEKNNCEGLIVNKDYTVSMTKDFQRRCTLNPKISKKDNIFFLIIIALLIISIVISLKFKGGIAENAELIINDKLIKKINLKENAIHEFDLEDGKLVLRVENRKIGITENTCPEKICMHQGFLQNKGEIIVCVPNKIIIKLLGESEIDSITK